MRDCIADALREVRRAGNGDTSAHGNGNGSGNGHIQGHAGGSGIVHGNGNGNGAIARARAEADVDAETDHDEVVSAGVEGPLAKAGAELVDDMVAKLDELWYVWSVVRELEPFRDASEPSLKTVAATQYLLRSGSYPELRVETLLQPIEAFLDRKGLNEQYIRVLSDWYLGDQGQAAEAGAAIGTDPR